MTKIRQITGLIFVAASLMFLGACSDGDGGAPGGGAGGGEAPASGGMD